MRGVSPARTMSPTASGAAAFLLMTLERQHIEAIAINAERPAT